MNSPEAKLGLAVIIVGLISFLLLLTIDTWTPTECRRHCSEGGMHVRRMTELNCVCGDPCALEEQ